jgi:two-component system, chemotaxis family, protein-glutamate methylesterase/glutaminase
MLPMKKPVFLSSESVRGIMKKKDIIVIGTSSGGIEALKTLVRGLPKEFNATIFVVLHTAPYGPGNLAQILKDAGRLPAVTPVDWEQFKAGHIYVAPPDCHLLLDSSGSMRVTKGPKENHFRPAINPLFRSASQSFGSRVIGLILTGSLDDGASGLRMIKQRGGMAIVQDPLDAQAPSMPLNALRLVDVDYCLPMAEIASLLTDLTNTEEEEEITKQTN